MVVSNRPTFETISTRMTQKDENNTKTLPTEGLGPPDYAMAAAGHQVGNVLRAVYSTGDLLIIYTCMKARRHAAADYPSSSATRSRR